MSALAEQRRARGECAWCGAPSTFYRCQPCRRRFNDYQAQYRARRSEQKLCLDCDTPVSRFRRCKPCRAKVQARLASWRSRRVGRSCADCMNPISEAGSSRCADCLNRKQDRERKCYQELRAAGLCHDCSAPAGQFARCETCRKRQAEAQAQRKAERATRKAA